MAIGIPNLNALLKRATVEDHEEILQACNAILEQTKENLDAQQAKVIALLKLERYDNALNVFEKSGEKLKAHAQLEHAYALYKSENFDLACGIAKRIDDDRGARHLEAQSSYRTEDFARAAEIYKDLSNNCQSAPQNEENELRINGIATDAQLEWKRQGHLVPKRRAGREDLEAFETAYNAACSYIARGEFAQGEVLLRKAKDLCSSSEDMTDMDKNAELSAIGVQELYVLGALDKAEQAKTLDARIVIDKIPDHSTRQIAQINRLTTTSQIANPYLAHRIFHSASSLPRGNLLFGYQRNLLLQNEVTLDLLASKFTGVIKATTKRLSAQNSATTVASVNGISVANAAAHAQNQLGKLGLKSILPLLEKKPYDVGLVLTIIHLYILTNNHGSAIAVLETFFRRLDESKAATDYDVRYAPGLVATMVSLYSIQGRKSHIRTELAKAAAYWKHRSKSSTSLLCAAGLSLLASTSPKDLSDAGEIFDYLIQKDSSDKFSIAGYVAAYATTNNSQVPKTVKELTSIKRLTAGINVESLESAGVPHSMSTISLNINKKRPADSGLKRAKKRFRKSRLPTEYDANKAPDPERWLPLRDRSTYRPKGKKGKQKAAALTQGGVNEKSAEGLNISNSEGMAKPASAVIGTSTKKSKKKKLKR